MGKQVNCCNDVISMITMFLLFFKCYHSGGYIADDSIGRTLKVVSAEIANQNANNV